MKKVMAIASGGGHWKQLMLILPAFENCDVFYVTTLDGLPQENKLSKYKIVKDSNKGEPLRVLVSALQVLGCIFKFNPDVVISTGAAPGLLGLAIARLCGKKTIWLDSIANGQHLSLGGRLSRKFAHTVLTQWPDLVDKKVKHLGAVF